MKFKMLFPVLGIFLFASISFAESPMDKYLSQIKIFENEDGRFYETFEDVDIKFDPFQKRNKPYSIVNKSTIPEGRVTSEVAQKYFKSFFSHAVLTEEEISFKDFLNEHFYLSYRNDETEIYRLYNFPLEQNINNPGTSTFFLCMDGNYEYVKKIIEFKPDSLSDRKAFYSNFKKKLLRNSTIVETDEVNNDKNYIAIFAKDRTPPKITFRDTMIDYVGNDDNTPIGKRNVCTTCDWYEMPDVPIIDNYAKELYARYSFGRINRCLIDGEEWEGEEHWDYPENVKKVDNGLFTDVVKFYPIEGYIRYSIFAKEGPQEGKGNLNPSIAEIKEDSPEICYGYGNGDIDLGNTLSTAKDWIDRRPITEVAEKGKDTRYLRMHDNDAPNIIIRVTNVETGEQMFFPPCLATGCLRINDSTLYKFTRGVTNEDEYNAFVENLGVAYDYKSIQKAPYLKPYYTIYSIDDKTIKTEKEDNYIHKLLVNNDVEFINQNVRVEDHFYSDTNSDGSRAKIQEVGELGRRKGTFVDMVALFENNGDFIFKTDEEYQLDVWIDDNVKWSNVEKGSSLGLESISSTAKVYSTGVAKGIINVDIPNKLKDEEEKENLSIEKIIDVNHAINGDIRFKLRKATPNVYDFKVPEDIEKEKFPSICVDIEDYAGLRRRIKLYFRVKDRNIEIRILENNKKSKN